LTSNTIHSIRGLFLPCPPSPPPLISSAPRGVITGTGVDDPGTADEDVGLSGVTKSTVSVSMLEGTSPAPGS
jgi:hypothetical protein